MLNLLQSTGPMPGCSLHHALELWWCVAFIPSDLASLHTRRLLNRWCETSRWHFANFKISATLFFVCLFLFFILSGCFLSLCFHNHHSFSVLKIYFRKLQRFLQVFHVDSLVLLLSLNTFKVLSKLSVDTYQSFLKRADSNLPFFIGKDISTPISSTYFTYFFHKIILKSWVKLLVLFSHIVFWV